MDTTRLIQARRLFCTEFADRRVQRANIRRWVSSLRFLGPKWVGLTNKDGIQAVEKAKEFS